jgi:hypothetical protein
LEGLLAATQNRPTSYHNIFSKKNPQLVGILVLNKTTPQLVGILVEPPVDKGL